MKRYILPLVLLALSSTAKANLIDRGNGMIYDQDLNITWSQNANINGLMTWSQANSWADGLTLGGFSDWRLPTTNDTGTAGCDFAYSGTDCGYNVNTSTSEMAHLFLMNWAINPYLIAVLISRLVMG